MSPNARFKGQCLVTLSFCAMGGTFHDIVTQLCDFRHPAFDPVTAARIEGNYRLAAVDPPAPPAPFKEEPEEPDTGVQAVTAPMPARKRKDRQNSAFSGFFSDLFRHFNSDGFTKAPTCRSQ